MNTLLTRSNRNGFPTIEDIGVTVSATAVTYLFNRHPNSPRNFSGGIFVKITSTYTAPATPLPIFFSTQGISNSDQAVLDPAGVLLTSATFEGPGVYLFFFDGDNNQLLRLTTVA